MSPRPVPPAMTPPKAAKAKSLARSASLGSGLVAAPAEGFRGRGAAENPDGRFERLHYELDGDALDRELQAAEGEPRPGPKTILLRDPSKTALSRNQSPDIPFDVSLNPYRGCEHGCSYCYARPTHEYLGFSAGLDFETRILVKDRLPELLERELGHKKWQPQVIAISGVTDAYQPVERRLRITRRCLDVLVRFRNPTSIVTKNALVTRDVDLIGELAAVGASAVNLSLTTLDAQLARVLEPRASHPQQRLRAIETLAAAGIPVGVMLAPIIPGLNDHEIPKLLAAAHDAGASFAGHMLLRLPYGVKDLFSAWLERHFPDRRKRVLARVREVRGGKLNDARFGSRFRGEGIYAEQIAQLFHVAARRSEMHGPRPVLDTTAFRRPAAPQLALFEDSRLDA